PGLLRLYRTILTTPDEGLDRVVPRQTKQLVEAGVLSAPSAEAVLKGAVKDPRRAIRMRAVLTLVALDRIAPEALPAWREAFRDAALRKQAAAGLARRAREAVPLLLPLLKDPAAEVRRETATLLGQLGSQAEAAIPALAARLRDRDPQVVNQAQAA